jgi:cyclohexanone monooxygenase
MSPNVREVDALVVSGGFGGIQLVNLLQNKLRLNTVVAIEKGSALGGTWALGILTNPYTPNFPGIDSFKGLSFHSARWPKGLDVTVKRVAVIGTGPSGSQITATVHPVVKQITVFQQRAQYIVPVNDRPVSEEEKKEI